MGSNCMQRNSEILDDCMSGRKEGTYMGSIFVGKTSMVIIPVIRSASPHVRHHYTCSDMKEHPDRDLHPETDERYT